MRSIIFLCCTTLFTACGNVSAEPTDSTNTEYHNPEAGLPSGECLNEDTPSTDSSGKAIYESVCATCHQSNGKGIVDVYPSLYSPWTNGNPLLLATIILRGVSGTIQVNDARFSSYMSGYGKEMSNAEIVALTKYIQETFHGLHPSITEEDVQGLRTTYQNARAIKGQAELDLLQQQYSTTK